MGAGILQQLFAEMMHDSFAFSRSDQNPAAYEQEIARRTLAAKAVKDELDRRSVMPETAAAGEATSLSPSAAATPPSYASLSQEELEALLRLCQKGIDRLRREQAIVLRLTAIAQRRRYAPASEAEATAVSRPAGSDELKSSIGQCATNSKAAPITASSMTSSVSTTKEVSGTTNTRTVTTTVEAKAVVVTAQSAEETEVSIETCRVVVERAPSDRSPSRVGDEKGEWRRRDERESSVAAACLAPLSNLPLMGEQERGRDEQKQPAPLDDDVSDESVPALKAIIARLQERIAGNDRSAVSDAIELRRLREEVGKKVAHIDELTARLAAAEELAGAATRRSAQEETRAALAAAKAAAQAEPAKGAESEAANEQVVALGGCRSAANGADRRLPEATDRGCGREAEDSLGTASVAGRDDKATETDECEALVQGARSESVLAASEREVALGVRDAEIARLAAQVRELERRLHSSGSREDAENGEDVAAVAEGSGGASGGFGGPTSTATAAVSRRSFPAASDAGGRPWRSGDPGCSTEASVTIFHALAERRRIGELEAEVEWLRGEGERLSNERRRLLEERDAREAESRRLAATHEAALGEMRRLKDGVAALQRQIVAYCAEELRAARRGGRGRGGCSTRTSPIAAASTAASASDSNEQQEQQQRRIVAYRTRQRSAATEAEERQPSGAASASSASDELQLVASGGNYSVGHGGVGGYGPFRGGSGSAEDQRTSASLQLSNWNLCERLRICEMKYEKKKALVNNLVMCLQLVRQDAEEKARALQKERIIGDILRTRLQVIVDVSSTAVRQREAELEHSVAAITALQTAVGCLRKRLGNRPCWPTSRGLRRRY